MGMSLGWWRRLLKRGEMERHLDAELRFHFDGLVADNVRAGMSEPEARRSARLEFGGVEQVKEECRDARGTRWLDELWQDLRFALRTLRKSPGFAIAVIGTLALGIGASIGIFSVVNTILLKPLQAPGADRIVRIMDSFQGVPSPTPGLPEFNVWRQQTQLFEDVSAYRLDLVNLTGRSNPELLPIARVSFGFFQLFGAPILRGRIFSEEEDRPGGPRVVLLSYEMWQRRFGNDPQAIGKALTFGTDSYTVIGILAPGFDTEQFSQLPSAWIPFQIDPDTPEHGSFCYVAGRLKGGITPAVAIAQLGPVATEYRARFPGYNKNLGSTVQPLREAMVSDVRSSLLVLAGAVTFVLLIAYSNVANLFLVRLEGRRREIAIRAAMGGGPGRIARQLITESLLLSLAAGTFGLLMGFHGIRVLLRFYPSAPLVAPFNPINLPRIGQAGSAVVLNWRVVVFTMLISMLTGLLFGILPALQASRADLNAPLKEGSGRS
jgi:putative ABC transport system permease protein